MITLQLTDAQFARIAPLLSERPNTADRLRHWVIGKLSDNEHTLGSLRRIAKSTDRHRIADVVNALVDDGVVQLDGKTLRLAPLSR